jgi:hypothetical protein
MNTDQQAIQIRLLAAEESPELRRLAERDTAELPLHPVLGGIVAGRLVAAHSLATDQSIADPFRRTAEIRSLLARRARELREGGPDRRLLGRVWRGLGSFGGRRATAPARAR